MSAILAFFLIFIVPFIIAPFGITQFENPKVIFAEAGIILLFLLSFFSKKKSVGLINPQTILMAIVIFLTSIDLIFFRTGLSLFGNIFRTQGIFLLWLLMLFAFSSHDTSFKKIPWWVYSILLYLQLIFVFVFSQNESRRYIGTLGEPNMLASFAIFLWPFALPSEVPLGGTKEGLLSKLGLIITFLAVITILILSNSKSGMIAFGIQMVFLLLSKFKLSVYKITLICLVIYFLSYIFPFFEHNQYENRVEVWKSAVSAGFSSPLIGNGFGNTELALHLAAHRLDLPIQYYYVDSSHNIFLDFWVEGGIVGLMVMIGLVFMTFKNFTRQKNIRGLVLFFGLLTALSFNPASIAGLLGFWWLIGQGIKFS